MDRLEELTDKRAADAARAKANAALRSVFRSDPDGFRTFLLGRDLCDSEQAFAASSLVEALAGGEGAEIRELHSYFDIARARLAACAELSRPMTLVLESYAFLEHGTGKHKFDMLPRYLELSKSPSAPLRRAAIALLGGFEVATAPHVRDELVRLLRDPDWEVRRGAEDLLREEGVLPENDRRSLADRVRRFIASIS